MGYSLEHLQNALVRATHEQSDFQEDSLLKLNPFTDVALNSARRMAMNRAGSYWEIRRLPGESGYIDYDEEHAASILGKLEEMTQRGKFAHRMKTAGISLSVILRANEILFTPLT